MCRLPKLRSARLAAIWPGTPKAMEAIIHRLPASSPDDLSAFHAAVKWGAIRPECLVAVIGKTEGNGCVNDFSRGLATMAWRQALGANAPAVALVMSGGTEGGMAPHWITVETRSDERADGPGQGSPALAVGVGRTRNLQPHEIGMDVQIDLVAAAVAEIKSKAKIDSVHFVQIKCPLLTSERIHDSHMRGFETATTDTLKSMGLSRGAAARGVAQALAEGAWSAVASTSAGVELMDHEIVVFGMSSQWTGGLMIDSAVMQDAFDIEPVRAALARLGLKSDGQLNQASRERVVALLAKAEASPDGVIRGHRHTMLTDSDISSTRHARALVAGVLGGLIGHGAIYVSGGAEYQGPPGGGPVAIIASKESKQ